MLAVLMGGAKIFDAIAADKSPKIA
jgi:hypothetical protein